MGDVPSFFYDYFGEDDDEMFRSAINYVGTLVNVRSIYSRDLVN